MWKLKIAHLNNSLKKKAKGKYSIQNCPRMRTTTHQILWKVAIIVHRGKSIA